jgi:hypothetical protein
MPSDIEMLQKRSSFHLLILALTPVSVDILFRFSAGSREDRGV